jgi:hypothetical protein
VAESWLPVKYGAAAAGRSCDDSASSSRHETATNLEKTAAGAAHLSTMPQVGHPHPRPRPSRPHTAPSRARTATAPPAVVVAGRGPRRAAAAAIQHHESSAPRSGVSRDWSPCMVYYVYYSNPRGADSVKNILQYRHINGGIVQTRTTEAGVRGGTPAPGRLWCRLLLKKCAAHQA